MLTKAFLFVCLCGYFVVVMTEKDTFKMFYSSEIRALLKL